MQDQKTVFVVHGRDQRVRDGMFAFLRSLGLTPLEWSKAVEATGKGSPYVGDVLKSAFGMAQAVVVVMTPDDLTVLRPDLRRGSDESYESEPTGQARPNVLFEAGMAMGDHEDRTIITSFGRLRPFSDIGGRHVLRMDNSAEKRKELAQRLSTAGCDVDVSGNDWLSAGDLSVPEVDGNPSGLPTGRVLHEPPQPKAVARVTAEYSSGTKGSGRLVATNRGTMAIHNLDIEIPDEAGPAFTLFRQGLPLSTLPPGKSAGFHTSRSMGPGSDYFTIKITGQTPDGEDIEFEEFISLV